MPSLQQWVNEYKVAFAGEYVVEETPPAGHTKLLISTADKRYRAVLDVSYLGDHLSIDVHGFVDNQEARVGSFGLDDGRRFAFGIENDPDHTSHGWPAVGTLVALIGKQAEVTEPT